MVQPSGDACRAWQLLMKFFFAQREHLPMLGARADLSPAQWHVLHLIEPDQPLPMGRSNPALMIAKVSVLSLLDSRPRFPERWVTSAMLRTPVAQPPK